MPGGDAVDKYMSSTKGGTQTGGSSGGGQGGGGQGGGGQGGGGHPGGWSDPKDQWIGQSQDTETYYGAGGQGTTNVNISDPSDYDTYDPIAAELAEEKRLEAKRLKEKEEADLLAKIEADRIAENKKRGLSIIGHGDVIEDYIGDTAWLAKYDTGQHKLRRQFDRLLAKYGPGFANTTQGKLLANYLAGVPVERGGGLGARDESAIGPTNVEDIPMYDPITGKYRSPEERQALADAAKYREKMLSDFAGMGIGSLEAAEAGSSGFDLSKLDIDKLRLGLSPEQYFQFRQQLMAADPTPGNQLYKDAFPWSSGSGIGALMEKVMPGANMFGNMIGGLFPEQSEWADWKANERIFEDTSMPV